MKKLLYTSLLFGCIAAANAQPMLEQANLPAFGTTAPISIYSGSVNAGPSGVSQTWDFSSLSMTTAATVTIVDPATTPNTSSFPTATMAYKFDFTLPSPNTRYNYYRESSGAWDLLGSEIGSTDPNDYTPNPRLELEFPLSYGNGYSDQYQTTDMGTAGTLTRTYDAYGTITTVHGTYFNVVRLAYSYDGGPTHYQWIMPNPVVMVFTINPEQNNAIAIGATATTSVEDNAVMLPNIFPTLVTNGFTVLTQPHAVRSVDLFDMTGRHVRAFENPTTGILKLSGIASGVYALRINGVNGNTHAKKIVLQ